jgi:signal transduction histidine kinase
MPASRNGPTNAQGSAIEQRLAKLSRINSVLMDRVERSMDQHGNAYSLFQTAIALEGMVRARTEELTAVLRRLERSNEDLVIAKEEAERANLSKTRFLAAASHDLLQPLHAARLSISVLSDMEIPKEALGITGQVERALQTFEDLIKTLLDISKLDAGVVQPDLRVVALDDLLSTVEASFRSLAEAKGLELRVRRGGFLIESDPVLLVRVLQNLVSNAVRYTAQGGVLIGVRRRSGDCTIEVIDTGSGIAESERETIFEEFYRGEAASPGGDSGLGLGLAIVRRIVRALGHRLDVHSRVGKGSRFRLTVPCVGAVPRPEVAGQHELSESADALADRAVVLIENDQNVIEATLRLLDRWSCHAAAAHRPQEVASLLAKLERAPDIVIADYHLDEGETGLDAIRELRRLVGADVPALVITADRTEGVAAEVRATGCDLLRKPFKPAELSGAMARLLEEKGRSRP